MPGGFQPQKAAVSHSESFSADCWYYLLNSNKSGTVLSQDAEMRRINFADLLIHHQLIVEGLRIVLLSRVRLHENEESHHDQLSQQLTKKMQYALQTSNSIQYKSALKLGILK